MEQRRAQVVGRLHEGQVGDDRHGDTSVCAETGALAAGEDGRAQEGRGQDRRKQRRTDPAATSTPPLAERRGPQADDLGR
jgi:hypothetical protein